MSTNAILLNQLTSSKNLKIKRVFFSTTQLNREKDYYTPNKIVPTTVSLPFEIDPLKTIIFINGGNLVSSSSGSSSRYTYVGEVYISGIEPNAITFFYSAAFYIAHDTSTNFYGEKGSGFNWTLIEFE